MFKTTALNSTANRFIDEVGVTPGTRLEAADKNIWMDELVNAVEGAGLTLDVTGANRDQLLEAMLIVGRTAKNFIINGIGEINQRGTADTLVKDQYTWDPSDATGPDRHEAMATGTAVSAGTFGVVTNSTIGVTGKAFKFAGVTLTGAGILYQRYRMEAKDAVKFKNQIASFSSKVLHDIGSGKDFTVFIRKANVADNFGAVTAISDSGAQSIDTATETDLKYESVAMGDCSNGIEIEIKIETGAITTKNVELTELQFELNSVATDFEYRNIGSELALCQRYCCKSYKQEIPPGTAGVAGNTKIQITAVDNLDYTIKLMTSFAVVMRDTPTVTLFDLLGASGKVTMTAGNGIAGTPEDVGDRGFNVSATNGAADTSRDLIYHFRAVSEL